MSLVPLMAILDCKRMVDISLEGSSISKGMNLFQVLTGKSVA